MTAHRALSLREAAPLLGVSLTTLYRRAALGTGYLDDECRVRVVTIGRRYVVPATDVASLLSQRQEPEHA